MKRLIALWFVVVGSILLASCASSRHTAVAQCLTAEGWTMYGTNRCSHCQKQKSLFGSSFAEVVFVDCDSSPDVCELAGVRGYPTWISTDGDLLSGVQSLDALSVAAGCDMTDAPL